LASLEVVRESWIVTEFFVGFASLCVEIDLRKVEISPRRRSWKEPVIFAAGVVLSSDVLARRGKEKLKRSPLLRSSVVDHQCDTSRSEEALAVLSISLFLFPRTFASSPELVVISFSKSLAEKLARSDIQAVVGPRKTQARAPVLHHHRQTAPLPVHPSYFWNCAGQHEMRVLEDLSQPGGKIFSAVAALSLAGGNIE
jgi:hypothetical protein